MKNYKAVILDDDIENIKLLNIYIGKYCKNINVIATATSVSECIELYFEHKPDILFLDIVLGNNDTSFSLIDDIKNIESEIIFISYHAEYALKAISMNVSGYIIKPVKINELLNVVSNAIKNICLKNQLHVNPVNDKHSKSILGIPYQSKIDLIDIRDIVYLEADSRYTIFHMANGNNKIACKNMGEYEKLLEDRHIFFRIHHRYIVNLNMVTKINKAEGMYCVLLNNKSLPIAKRRIDGLNKFLHLK